MAKKRFASVAEMVRELSDDQSFADDLDNRLRERQVIKALLAMRAVKGMNQQDIAERLDCTQSRISKLESSNDGDLRLADICAYASAVGLSVEIVLMRKDATLVDRVKFHAGCIKRLMDRLAHLAKGDKQMSNGVLGFFGEAAYNLLNMVQCAAKVVQDAARQHIGQRDQTVPAFAVEVCDDDPKETDECREAELVG